MFHCTSTTTSFLDPVKHTPEGGNTGKEELSMMQADKIIDDLIKLTHMVCNQLNLSECNN